MIIQGLKRLSTPLPKSERKHLFVCNFNLDTSEYFVFFEGTAAVRISLNEEKFGMLYGNHIRGLIRRRIGLSRFQGITYELWAKGCYADSRALVGSYLETIYT